jgi:5-methylcytosine-specific restriction endonuclease McrA
MNITTNWLENTINKLQKLVSEERRINVEILEILWEIERRKAFSDLGYEGLFTFCMRELKFSESQTFQRIQSMRALKQVPELKEKIESGAMSMTTVSQVQVYLRQEQLEGAKYSKNDKVELFKQFENKTSKQVKLKIAELKGEQFKVKLNLELDEEAEKLWSEVKANLAHQSFGCELKAFKILMMNHLKHQQKLNQETRRNVSRLTKVNGKQSVHIRTIPKAMRREIKTRDGHSCKNCGSKYALQIEHKLPYAKGGTSDLQNLELLCRNCNVNRGVKEFGLTKMKR